MLWQHNCGLRGFDILLLLKTYDSVLSNNSQLLYRSKGNSLRLTVDLDGGHRGFSAATNNKIQTA
jgi:hypothetical protein